MSNPRRASERPPPSPRGGKTGKTAGGDRGYEFVGGPASKELIGLRERPDLAPDLIRVGFNRIAEGFQVVKICIASLRDRTD